MNALSPRLRLFRPNIPIILILLAVIFLDFVPSGMRNFLLPWNFSPFIFCLTIFCGFSYARGMGVLRRQGLPRGFWKPLSFWLSLGLFYGMLQTRFDYYAQHVFFMHRLQHMVLHHLAPFLMALSWPQQVLKAGMPSFISSRWLPRIQQNHIMKRTFNFLQHPFVSPVLFVGIIYFWLWPALHFDAMINLHLYNIMNWSMAFDGLLFWFLMCDPRPYPVSRIAFGRRILILWAIMLPQIALGAVIALSPVDLYPSYALCGRAFNINPIVDQHLGGLITWIPSSMMSAIGSLAVLRMMVRHDERIHEALRVERT